MPEAYPSALAARLAVAVDHEVTSVTYVTALARLRLGPLVTGRQHQLLPRRCHLLTRGDLDTLSNALEKAHHVGTAETAALRLTVEVGGA